MLKFAIYCSHLDVFKTKQQELQLLGIAPSHILFANSSEQSRWDIINQNLGFWIFFLDHDCSITKESLSILNDFIISAVPTNTVLAGNYINPINANNIQRTHNFIANTWLNQSYDLHADKKLLLGGVFLVYCTEALRPQMSSAFWGAEDKFLAYLMSENKFSFYLNKKLQVIHYTNRGIKHFVRRAYLHGVNDVKEVGKNHNKFNFLYWINNIDFSDLNLMLLLLLHFFVQKAAKLIQIVRQMNKIKM